MYMYIYVLCIPTPNGGVCCIIEDIVINQVALLGLMFYQRSVASYVKQIEGVFRVRIIYICMYISIVLTLYRL